MDVRFRIPLLSLLVLAGCEVEIAGQARDQPSEAEPVFTPLATPTDLETRTFALEHLGVATATGLVGPYVYKDRPGAPGVISLAPDATAISVRETPDNLDKIGRMLEEFDVASTASSYRLHFQVVVGNGTDSTDERLALVEKELRKVFRFEGYSLLGEGHVAVSEGPFELQIETQASEPLDPKQKWRIHIDGGIYRGDEMHLEITDLPPGMATSVRTTGKVETRLGFRPGQTLVLGSMPSQNQTVFVVVHVSQESESA